MRTQQELGLRRRSRNSYYSQSCRPSRSYFGDVIDKQFDFGVHLFSLSPAFRRRWNSAQRKPRSTQEIADSALTAAGGNLPQMSHAAMWGLTAIALVGELNCRRLRRLV